jgi:hypothetical protein
MGKKRETGLNHPREVPLSARLSAHLYAIREAQ